MVPNPDQESILNFFRQKNYVFQNSSFGKTLGLIITDLELPMTGKKTDKADLEVCGHTCALILF